MTLYYIFYFKGSLQLSLGAWKDLHDLKSRRNKDLGFQVNVWLLCVSSVHQNKSRIM